MTLGICIEGLCGCSATGEVNACSLGRNTKGFRGEGSITDSNTFFSAPTNGLSKVGLGEKW